MPTLQVAHTSDLGAPARAAIRALLDEAFDDMGDEDWEHALGGVHAVVWDDGVVVGHASVVMRRLLHGGRALRTGYVEAVAVRADRRGEGHGARVMEVVEGVIRGAYEVGALGSTDEAIAFYERRGWRRWAGRTFALTPTGTVRTADDDDAVFVLPVAGGLDLAGDLICDWRDGDVW